MLHLDADPYPWIWSWPLLISSSAPPQVDSFEFWYPLISGIGCPLPSFRIPFRLAYLLGFLFELIYRTIGWEPLFTRSEVIRWSDGSPNLIIFLIIFL